MRLPLPQAVPRTIRWEKPHAGSSYDTRASRNAANMSSTAGGSAGSTGDPSGNTASKTGGGSRQDDMEGPQQTSMWAHTCVLSTSWSKGSGTAQDLEAIELCLVLWRGVSDRFVEQWAGPTDSDLNHMSLAFRWPGPHKCRFTRVGAAWACYARVDASTDASTRAFTRVSTRTVKITICSVEPSVVAQICVGAHVFRCVLFVIPRAMLGMLPCATLNVPVRAQTRQRRERVLVRCRSKPRVNRRDRPRATPANSNIFWGSFSGRGCTTHRIRYCGFALIEQLVHGRVDACVDARVDATRDVATLVLICGFGAATKPAQ